MTDYIALIHKDADSDFGVSFPDLPGCVTAAPTLDAAKGAAAEVLAFHLDGMREDGLDIPPPSSLEEIMAEKENRDAVALLVSSPDRVVRAVRINITVPEDVLQEIDSYAQSHGYSRSGLLVKGAKKLIEA